MDILFTLLVAVVFVTIVTILVAAHELGHYLFARLFNMDVEEFAVGFGSQKWVWMRRGDTIFTIRPWPLGGFVRIKGMMPHDDGSEVHIPNGFYSKPPWQRWLVLFAGPVFSVLAGLAILVPLYSTNGVYRNSNKPIIGQVVVDGPAHKAGLQEGDRILRADGESIETYYELIAIVRDWGERPLPLLAERDGRTFETLLTPVRTQQPEAVIGPDLRPGVETRYQYRMMAGLPREHVRLSFAEASGEAFMMPVRMVMGIVAIFRNATRFQQEVGGPVTIVRATAAVTREGAVPILELAGALSISLGIFNLLPFPPLDGGQMVIATAEMARRGRRLSIQVQRWVSGLGLGLVLLLFLSVFAIDIRRLVTPPQPVQTVPSQNGPESVPSEPPAAP